MPSALDDLLHGRDPYATRHDGTGIIERPWGEQPYAWSTTFPYLPLAALLQVPLLDYRITALLAYGLLLGALRDASARAFFAFANPLVLWLAASGFNDFVPLALLAWADRLRAPILAGLAAACKQLVLPLLLVQAALARDARRIVLPLCVACAITLPFVLWDPAAFWGSAVLPHVAKLSGLPVFVNYLLYPLYVVAMPAPRGPPVSPEPGVTA
jgi:uncharacterized membrane protein